MALPSGTTIQMSQVNTEMGRSSTAQLAFSDSGMRTLAGVPSGQYGMSTLWGKSWFTLTNPTPGGLSEATGVVPGSATAYVKPYADGNIFAYGYGNTAFGSATGTNIAAGKYWKWNYYSGQVPTSGTVAENTWTAVGTGQVNMNRSGTAGARTGSVTISFANDASGTGATTGGVWTLSAIIEF